MGKIFNLQSAFFMLVLGKYIGQSFLTSGPVIPRCLQRNVLLKFCKIHRKTKNYLFNFGNLSFRQIIGILVSSDPAPFFSLSISLLL